MRISGIDKEKMYDLHKTCCKFADDVRIVQGDVNVCAKNSTAIEEVDCSKEFKLIIDSYKRGTIRAFINNVVKTLNN